MTETQTETMEVRVEHPSLPYGYTDGFVSPSGLFVTRREGAGWLWDVWVSPEAFAVLHDEPVALLAGNLPSLADAMSVVGLLEEGEL